MASNKQELIVEPDEFTFWTHLGKVAQSGIEELCDLTGLDQSKVVAIATEAEAKSLVQIDVRERQELLPSPDAKQAVEGGLPERRALALMGSATGPTPMPEFVELMKKQDLAVNEVVRWGKTRGWLVRGKDGVEVTELGRKVAQEESTRC